MGQTTPQVTLNLPISPATLNTMIYAAQLSGIAIAGVDMVPVTVPAGTTVYVTLPTRPGYVTVSTGPLKVFATYYSPLISMSVIVDGNYLTSPDYPYLIADEDAIDFGMYYFFEQGVMAIITNGSATPTTIYFRSQGLALDRDWFYRVYRPLMQFGSQTLMGLADSLAAGNGGTST